MKNGLEREAASLYGPLAVLGFFVASLVFVSALSAMSPERYAPGHKVYTVKKRASAYGLLRKLHVKGRTMIYFGRLLPLGRGTALRSPKASRTSKNKDFIYLSLLDNLVGRIYRVVPDGRWSKVMANFAGNQSAFYDGKRINTASFGTPIIVTRLRDVPVRSQKAVIFIESNDVKDYGFERIREIAGQRRFSDIVIVRTGKASYAF